MPGPLSALTSLLPLIVRGGLPLSSLPGLSDDVKTGHGGEKDKQDGTSSGSLEPGSHTSFCSLIIGLSLSNLKKNFLKFI